MRRQAGPIFGVLALALTACLHPRTILRTEQGELLEVEAPRRTPIAEVEAAVIDARSAVAPWVAYAGGASSRAALRRIVLVARLDPEACAPWSGIPTDGHRADLCASADGSTLYVELPADPFDDAGRQALEQALRHGMVHALLAGDQPSPWLEEGMAELAELRAPLGPPPSRPLDRGALKAWLGAADDWSKVDGSEARVLASLLSSFPLSVLGQGVLDDSELLADYLPSSFVLEEETGPLHCGSVLLVHGSAPFDMDGRIPIEDPELRYGREPFYADLGARLRAAGWAVLRYAKPGVSSDGLDMTRYMTTDVSLLGLQLQNLWRFLPEDRPRVVVAWSEGTLHVSQLPLDEVKGIVFLGGISTDLADIVAAQGGPSKDALMAELTGLPRDAPLGLDRPVGRVLDEVSMEPNWVTLSRDFPGQLLVLHGGADEEVPVSQARGWVGRFPEGRLTVVIGDGLDHRYMDPGVYQPERPGDVIADWLGREFGAGCVGPPG